MSESFSIPIPADVDGYVLLQCPLCKHLFKLMAGDVEKADVVFCPSCGMKSDSYVTREIVQLAQAKAINYAEDELYAVFKQLERKTRGGFISIKAGKKPKHEPENPIRNKIEAMGKARFDCCGKTCKTKPLLIMTGCYCPFCGVKEYEP